MSPLALIAVVLTASADGGQKPASVQLTLRGVEGKGVAFDALQQYLQAQADSVIHCFQTQAPPAEARVHLSFALTPASRSADVTVETEATVEATCVQDLVRHWAFPFQPAAAVKVLIAVAYAPGSDPRPVPPAPIAPMVPGPQGARGAVVIGTPVVKTKNIPPDDFARFVAARKAPFLICYEKELGATPKLKGTLTLRFTITPWGRTSDITTDGNALGEVVPLCVRTVLRGWVFPWKPEAEVPVEVPLTFSPESDKRMVR